MGDLFVDFLTIVNYSPGEVYTCRNTPSVRGGLGHERQSGQFAHTHQTEIILEGGRVSELSPLYGYSNFMRLYFTVRLCYRRSYPLQHTEFLSTRSNALDDSLEASLNFYYVFTFLIVS